MSEFEFVSVLLSVIYGLGVTHLLKGLGRFVDQRRRPEFAHGVWAAGVFLTTMLQWWTLFAWRTTEQWTFASFLCLTLLAISYYVMTLLLFPPGIEDAEAQARAFDRNRGWFLHALAAMLLLDGAQMSLRGAIFSAPGYLPFVGHLLVICLVVARTASPAVHRAFAIYYLAAITSWTFLVRPLLG
jgi:hypothetical protein